MIHESKKRIFDEIYGRARLIRGKLWKRANNKCVDAHCLFVGKEKKKKFSYFSLYLPLFWKRKDRDVRCKIFFSESRGEK